MTEALSTLTGLNVLSVAVQAKPLMVISFYPYGILMRRTTDNGGETEYPVSAAQLAAALAAKVQFSTGILSENTLYIGSEGVRKVIVEYRKSQKTALYLEGTDEALVVPLPGLVLIRVTTANDNPRYGIYAVKKRPCSLETDLYLCPLPNTNYDGICWGTVKKVSPDALAGNDLTEDWRLLLGSVFTNHSVHGKSQSHPQDIRHKFVELEQRQARVYPTRDLTKLNMTLADVLERVQR